MHKTNNFDFLRILFASFVIITHSYPLSGQEECDIFCQVFDGQQNLSYLGVRGFFAISGYLIFHSLMNSPSIQNYLWKRVLRIYPALIIALLFSTIIGYFAYSGVSNYWSNSSTWTYLPKNLASFFFSVYQTKIEGVFSSNRYGATINGSLWSISYELAAYIILIPFFFIRNKKMFIVYSTLITSIILIIMATFFPNRGGNYNIFSYIFGLGHNLMMNVYSYFVVGCFLAAIKIEKFSTSYRNILLISSSIILFVSLLLGFFRVVEHLFYPVIVILIGISSWYPVNQIGQKIGDLSYGFYIYSFPIQQMIEYLWKPTPLHMIFISFLFVIPLAYLSWHYIEKPIMKYKNWIK